MVRRTSRNTSYSSGVSRPRGIYNAVVKAVGTGTSPTISVTIPRIGLNNVYENVPVIGDTPLVGDNIHVGFLEGNSSAPVAFAIRANTAHLSDSAPAVASEGDLWRRLTDGSLFIYYNDGNSLQWVELVNPTGVTVSLDPPDNPANLDLWLNLATSVLSVYYDDGNSSQWLQVGSSSLYDYTLPLSDGSAGQVLKTDGSGNVSWQVDVGAGSGNPSGNNGAIQFTTAGGLFGSDETNLFWDDANNRLGVGTNTPSVELEVDGSIVATHIEAEFDGPSIVAIKNTSGSTIAKGSPVYPTGSVGASGAVEVSAARADTATAMPALGVTDTQLVANAEGHAVVLGVIDGMDTSSYTIGDTLYVAPTGGLTNVKPTSNASHLIQNIGKVIRVNASTGEILVSGSGRTNDVPNSFSTTGDISVGGNISVTGTVDGRDVATDGAKLDYLTVTQAVDLDAIESRVNALDAAVVLQGSWDASGGSFPGAGSAQAGDSYIVSVAGTVDGVAFSVNDRLLAIVDSASTSTYASNWLKLDYTDQVLSVNSQTGAVVLDADDIDDANTTNKFVTATDITNLGNLSGTNTGDQDLSSYQLKPSEGAFADGDKTKLDGIETNATADQTAADIRTLGFFDTSNDGAGSGLDADLLDGNHASAFATSSQGTLADSALQDVVDDTTPQLGGSLDVNGQEITGAIDLHSTGDVVIELGDAAGTNKVSVRDSAAVEVASINSDGDISAQDIVVAGTVDGRDVAADGSKLDGIAAGAEVNTVDSVNSQTGAVVLDADDISDASTTNKFTTAADITKLAGIAAGAEVNTVDSVNSQTGAVVLDADDISDASTTNKFVTAADITNLGNLSGTNTGDQDLSSYQLKPSEGAFADGDKTKLDYLTVTQAVDLDDIETRVNALDAAVVLQGSWDASAGSFPGSGSAQAGDSYIVSVAGTVDSVAFSVNDRLLAIVDNASTSTYASNWLKLDYTDQVLSVNSQTGAVDLDADDISDASTTNKFVTAADITNLGNLSGTNTGDQDLSSYQLQPSEGAFANGDKTKLDGIEAGADVTDAANVETAIEAISLTSTSGDTGDEVLIIDATDGQLKAVLWEALPSVAVASAAPSTPSNGHLWFDTDTGQTFIYYDDGTSTQWVEVGAVGEFAMTTASAAPSNPSNGDMWFDTTNGKTFVYYVETGGSSQWVEVGAASAGASGVDGSVQFSSGGTFTSDNANFYWDDTNNRLGIGTNSPQEALELEGTSPLLRITSNNTAPVLGTLLGGLQWYGNDDTIASGVGAYIAAYGGGASGEQQLRFGTGTQAAVASRMTIDSSGKVGIGTNSPSRLLTLNATDSYIGWSEGGSEGWVAGYEGSNDRWVLYGGTPNGTRDYRIVVLDDGKVGIGTDIPETPLNIVTTNTLGATFTGTTDGEGLRVDQSNYTSGNYVSLIESSYQDDQTAPHVRIGAKFTGSGSYLSFGTSNSYASGITNEALTIDYSGNVGIGTTSPLGALDIHGNTESLIFSSPSDTNRYRIDANITDAADFGLSIGYWDGSAYQRTLTVDDSGKVGIGTTTPRSEFHVEGSSDPELSITSTDASNPALYFGDSVDSVRGGIRYNTANNRLELQGYNNSTGMVIASAGNVGINDTTPSFTLDVNGQARVGGSDDRTPNASGDGHLMINGNGYTGFASLDGNAMWVGHNSASRHLKLATDETERVRITSGGLVEVGQYGTSQPGTAARLYCTTSNNVPVLSLYSVTTASASVLAKGYSHVAGNAQQNYAVQFVIRTNGDFESRSNTYGAYSDLAIKQDIVDAPSQWDDIKAVQLRKFRLIDDVTAHGDDAVMMLGVIAQELEAAGMSGLVSDAAEDQPVLDENGEPTGEFTNDKPYKSVKYSILLLKALGALQEAMARIEALEAQ